MTRFYRVGAGLACACVFAFAAAAQEPSAPDPSRGIRVGTYDQQVGRKFTRDQGLPSTEVSSIAIAPDGTVVAATSEGVAQHRDGRWQVVFDSYGVAVSSLTVQGNRMLGIADGTLYAADASGAQDRGYLPPGKANSLAAGDDDVWAATDEGLFRHADARFSPVTELNDQLGGDRAVRQVAVGPEGKVAVAAAAGLYERTGETWQRLLPRDDVRSWAPVDVRGVAYDAQGRLWFASPQGAGVRDGESWTLYTGEDGLPYNDFTCVTAGDGEVWFGTRIGAIRFDGENWEYRQGLRWFPGDEIRSIALDGKRNAWFATDKGVGLIEYVPITLAEKARRYEEAIDTYHRRTPYGYVLDVRLPAPGDLSSWEQHDSDNDGLWTSMYGAGECFAYAATRDPVFKERAKKAFEALKFLMDVTQGGTPPAQPGFVARTILPTSGPNPNEHDYSPERDRQRQRGDKLWKVMDPRWGTSADGEWYWKSDTSSDELDGHYFFHACYYDLVAETEEEKQACRDVIAALTDHLVRNNFQLIDHDGLPTRWAVFDPERFNGDTGWFVERGLNSLSMLSYLAVAHHMTGDAKYADAMDTLIEEHGYLVNLMYPKFQNGPGSGNQSDDEMAFMSYYNLLKYAPEGSKLREAVAFSWWNYWQLEKYERNPLFNFMFAAMIMPDETYVSPFATIPLYPRGDWLEQSVDTLKRFPLDRVNWRVRNSHRIDIVRLPNHMRDPDDLDLDRPFGKGHLRNGYVLPYDEQFVNHWNHDPWRLDQGGDGRDLADGASFLLPYYMGLFHGFIVE